MAEGQNNEEGIIKPWGDPSLREPDLKPGEGAKAFQEDKLEKARQARKIPGPGNPSSIKQWNTEMVRPIDDKGNYRKVDPATGLVIKGNNPKTG